MDSTGATRKLERQSYLTWVSIICAVTLAACANPYSKKDSAPKKPSTRVDRSEKIVPKVEPKSKYGNPTSYVVFGRRYFVLDSSQGYVEQGIASWYGTKFHGRRTSSGETYDMYAMTAAHKSLPLPTYARVTNKKNGRSIIVRINDRGPFVKNRIIDLSYAAATKLGIVTTGTGLVEVRAIDPRSSDARRAAQRKELPEDVVDVAANPEEVEATVSKAADTLPSADAIEKEVGIYVQLGAFRSRDNAHKLRAQFSALDVGDVKVKEVAFEDAPIYKVWIGPLDTVEQADNTVDKITQLGHKDYKLVFENKP